MGNPKRSAASLIATPDERNPQFVNAVGRAFSILRCFEHGERYLGNQEIVKRTGMPKPTVSRLCYTLATLGYLEYSAALEKYTLGTAVLSMSHAFMKGQDVVTLARPLMQELAQYTQSAVMLGSADGMRMVVLEICQGDNTFHLKLQQGSRVPHGTTALGRADLAARPPEIFERRLHDFQRECEPAQWPKIRDGLIRARQEYESYGFCFSLGEWNPDVFAVGVPLVSQDRSRILALNCSGRVTIMTRDKLIHDIGPRLVAVRNTILEMTKGRF